MHPMKSASFLIIQSSWFPKDSTHSNLLAEMTINIRRFVNRNYGEAVCNRSVSWLY